MQRFVFVFLFPFLCVLAACGETRVEIIHEVAGCETDLACDDHDETSVDSCEFASGICNHERVVMSGCVTFLDCDDGDMTSVDTCVDAVCNHSRDVVASFDPASPERQDVRALCEQPFSCDLSVRPSVSLSWNPCYGRRDPWNENGYPLWLTMPDLGPDPSHIRIRPQLRVGDPTDLFRVTVRVNENLAPVLVQDMTGHELEDEGILIEYATPAETWMGRNMFITIDFVRPDTYNSRTLQWAIPPGGAMNVDTGADLNPCLQVGQFMDVPEHGLLRLTQEYGTELPRCTGTVRGPDSWAEDARLPDGLFRTVSDSRLYYGSATSVPARLVRFDTLREFVDWWQQFYSDPNSIWSPTTMCSNAVVYDDDVLLNAMAEWETETVGARPGTPVTWFDTTTRIQHYGFADRQWTILDIGTDPMSSTLSGYACSWYDAIPSRRSIGAGYNCWLDLQGWSSRYTTVATDPTTINSEMMSRESGWLLWYNRDFPTGP